MQCQKVDRVVRVPRVLCDTETTTSSSQAEGKTPGARIGGTAQDAGGRV